MCSAFYFFVGSLKVSLQEFEKWSFTAGWGGCEEGDRIFSHLRELTGHSLGVHCQVGTAVAGGLFPKGRGVGWSQICVSVPRMRWEHLSLPSVTVFVGKNREAQHELMLFIWWYQIISFWSSVYFYLGWGEGVCSKDLKMLHFFLYKWLIGHKPEQMAILPQFL